MQIKIENIHGKWLLNGKTYQECNFAQQYAFNEYFKTVKLFSND